VHRLKGHEIIHDEERSQATVVLPPLSSDDINRTGACRLHSVLHLSVREMHWLPVTDAGSNSVHYVVLCCLNGLPVLCSRHCMAWHCRVLSGECQRVSDTIRWLHSSNMFSYVVPWTRTRLGNRLFAVADPLVWNMLSASLCLVDRYMCFRRLLKAHLLDWGCGV